MCKECESLSAPLEAETIHFFRIESQVRRSELENGGYVPSTLLRERDECEMTRLDMREKLNAHFVEAHAYEVFPKAITATAGAAL